AQRQGFNLFRVTIRIDNRERLRAVEREHLFLMLRRLMRENLRGTDLAFFAHAESDVVILCTCDDESDIQLVITRLQIAVIRCAELAVAKISLNYEVKAWPRWERFNRKLLYAEPRPRLGAA